MPNLRPYPLVRLFIPILAGILFAYQASLNENNIVDFQIGFPFFSFSMTISGVILLLGLQTITLKYNLRYLNGAVIFSTLFSFGYFLMSFQDFKFTHHHYATKVKENSFASFLVSIGDVPTENNVWSMTAKVHGIYDSENRLVPCSGKLKLYLDRKIAFIPSYGQYLIVRSKIKLIQKSLNPYSFDYRSYLCKKGIYYSSFASENNINVLEGFAGNKIVSIASESQKYMTDLILNYVPDTTQQGVASALLLGNRQIISDEINRLYADTGAVHILAVSGMHLGILYGALILILSRIPIRKIWWKRFQWVPAILIIWFYVFLTGMSGSVVRAGVMFSIMAMGGIIDRRSKMMNSLAAASIIMAIVNPYYMLDVGVQLSLAAVSGILLIEPFLNRVTSFNNKFIQYFWRLTTVSIAATLGTLPFTLFYFHQFPTYFWLSSLPAIPFSMAAMAFGGLLFILDPIIPILSPWLGKLLGYSVLGMNTSLSLISKLPYHIIEYVKVDKLGFVFLIAVVTFLSLGLVWKWRRGFLISGIFLLMFSGNKFLDKYSRLKEEKLVIYHVKGNSVVDILKDNTVLCKTYSPISSLVEKNVTAGFRTF
jgi:competence protein ComEC